MGVWVLRLGVLRVLQCVGVCCSVLQGRFGVDWVTRLSLDDSCERGVAVCCVSGSVSQRGSCNGSCSSVCCRWLRYVAVRCSMLQWRLGLDSSTVLTAAVCCGVLGVLRVLCVLHVLQCVAVRCGVLQGRLVIDSSSERGDNGRQFVDLHRQRSHPPQHRLLLQCDAECCSVLKCVAVFCSVSSWICADNTPICHNTACCFSVLQCVAVRCSVFQRVVVRRCILQRILTRCKIQQRTVFAISSYFALLYCACCILREIAISRYFATLQNTATQNNAK